MVAEGFGSKSAAGKETARPGPLDARRLEETVRAIPEGITTVLDAGCGRGWLSEALSGRYEVVALDYVHEVLCGVGAKKVRGDVCRLPFGDRTFDLVCCCETLEHLDDLTNAAARGELVRVSKKHVLVTVPNAEDLERRYWRCPKCAIKFSPYGHVRSYREEEIEHVFDRSGGPTMKAVAIKGIVRVKVWRQSRVLEGLRPERMGYWSKGTGVTCPHCGFSGYPAALQGVWRVWSFAVRLLNAALHPVPVPWDCWLLGLYEKSR